MTMAKVMMHNSGSLSSMSYKIYDVNHFEIAKYGLYIYGKNFIWQGFQMQRQKNMSLSLTAVKGSVCIYI